MPDCPIWELKREHLGRRLQVWFDAQPDRPAQFYRGKVSSVSSTRGVKVTYDDNTAETYTAAEWEECGVRYEWLDDVQQMMHQLLTPTVVS